MRKNYDSKGFEKKHNNLYTIMGVISDIIFYPIIIISLFCCGIIYIDKSENRLPSIFGISLVSISSGSMEKGGFEINDIIFLKSVDSKNLRAGDIIGFYYYKDDVDENLSIENLELVQTFDRENETSTPYELPTPIEEKTSTRASVEEVSTVKRANLYFHRIINIYADQSGTLFYQTQGDSNLSTDDYLICEDYVAGVYSLTPEFLRGIFKFIASSTGMIMTVVVPLSLLILFMSFSIIEQIYNIFIERKVLRREIRYDSPESMEANVGIEMDRLDKIDFFSKSPIEERPKVAQFLWGFLKHGKKREVKEYEKILHITDIFEDNPKHFWMYWINNTRSDTKKRKIEKLWQNWDLERPMKKLTTSKKPKGLKKEINKLV